MKYSLFSKSRFKVVYITLLFLDFLLSEDILFGWLHLNLWFIHDMLIFCLSFSRNLLASVRIRCKLTIFCHLSSSLYVNVHSTCCLLYYSTCKASSSNCTGEDTHKLNTTAISTPNSLSLSTEQPYFAHIPNGNQVCYVLAYIFFYY